MRPKFEKGGKLEKWFPVYDSLATFLFTPDHVTHNGSHIRDGIDLKRTMFMVILALVPCLLFGMWNVGYQHYLALGETSTLMDNVLYGSMKVLPLVIVSYGVGLGVEFAFCIIKKHAIQEGFLVSGMLIPLVMPPDVPLWMVAISTIFAVVIGKEVFGGTGMNIVNVALTARAFLFFAYPTKMSGNVWISKGCESGEFVDGVTGATALGDLVSSTSEKMADADVMKIADSFADGGTYDFMSSLMGTIPGSIGETSAIACALGGILLLITGIGSWRVMLSFLLGGLAMGFLFNVLTGDEIRDTYYNLSPLHQIVLGGFMFGMVFMATDPVTAAQTNTGKWIYGFLGGFLAILIRVVNPAYPEGVMMAILFMNVMAPLIDHYVIQANVKRRLKRTKVAA